MAIHLNVGVPLVSLANTSRPIGSYVVGLQICADAQTLRYTPFQRKWLTSTASAMSRSVAYIIYSGTCESQDWRLDVPEFNVSSINNHTHTLSGTASWESLGQGRDMVDLCILTLSIILRHGIMCFRAQYLSDVRLPRTHIASIHRSDWQQEGPNNQPSVLSVSPRGGSSAYYCSNYGDLF